MRSIRRTKFPLKTADRKEPSRNNDSIRSQFVSLCVVCCFVLLAGLSSCDELVTEKIFVTVLENPRAEFSSDIDSGCAPLTVNFFDDSPGPHNEWLWDFGDGNTSILSQPEHTFELPGTYDITLKITDNVSKGFDTEFKKRFIVVGESVTDFTVSPNSGCVGLQVTFTPVTAGSISSLVWFFGDGDSSLDSIATHTYDSTGEFIVSLRAFGDCNKGFTLIDSPGVVISNCPTAIFFTDDPRSGCIGLSVTFDDSSISAGLPITSRIWGFGDGTSDTSNDSSPTHTYTTAGDFTVSLEVSTSGGTNVDSIVDYITVIDNTVADFQAISPTSSCISSFQQFLVQFEDMSIGEITSRKWRVDLDDSVFSTAPSPIYHFENAGSYDITLIVEGVCGIDSITKTVFVVLSEPITSGGFTVTPDSAMVDSLFTFTDNSSIAVTSRTWDFGDGTPSLIDSSVVTHSYSSVGTYIVSLVLTNSCGSFPIIDSVVVIP